MIYSALCHAAESGEISQMAHHIVAGESRTQRIVLYTPTTTTAVSWTPCLNAADDTSTTNTDSQERKLQAHHHTAIIHKGSCTAPITITIGRPRSQSILSLSVTTTTAVIIIITIQIIEIERNLGPLRWGRSRKAPPRRRRRRLRRLPLPAAPAAIGTT
ncbi:unnamed protein product, partial [Ectocarpus sp. 12 AP-2014]